MNKAYLKVISFLKLLNNLNEKMLLFSMHFIVMLKNELKNSDRKYFIQLIHKITLCNIDLQNDTIRKLFIDVLSVVMNTSTLTIQMLVFKETYLIQLYNEYPTDCKILTKYVCYTGIKALDIIMELVKNHILLDYYSAMICIHLIPIHFKLQRTFEIINAVEHILKTKTTLLVIDQQHLD